MKKLRIALSVFCLAGSAFAAARTNTVVSAMSDWTDPNSFTDTSWLPGSGDDDTVIIPKNALVTLSAADAASVTQFKKLKRIILASKTSEIDIVVDEGELELEVPITQWGYYSGSDDSMYGPIVKKGLGTLHLASNTLGTGFDYYSSMRVDEGTLKLNQNGDKTGYQYGTLTVAKDATLYLPILTVPDKKGGDLSVSVRALAGEGTITTDMGSPWYKLSITGMADIEGSKDFSGLLSGKYYQFIVLGTAQTLSGTANTAEMMNYEFGTKSGSLGVAKFGNKNEASSLGVNNGTVDVDAQTFRFTYLGEGETCNRNFNLFGRSGAVQGPYIFDAGATGGLCLSGNYQRNYKSTIGQGLVLAGDGSALNTFSGTITDNSDSTTATVNGHVLYLSKEGAGTWLLSGTTRGAFGCGISVNEGVLQYASIAPAGQTCALGYATNRTDGTIGTYDKDAAHRVGYALRLGAPTTAGAKKESARLEYTGTTAFTVTNREIAVAGTGGLRANGSAAQRFSGVYGISSEAMKLVLDGSSTADNEVNNVSDGAGGGKLSVTKEGTGKWILSGEQSWGGDLAVKGGELVIRNPQNYRWYKWVITSLFGGEDVTHVKLGEFCLCGDDHVEVTRGYTFVSDNTGLLLEPGQAALVTKHAHSSDPKERLFDGLCYNKVLALGIGEWVGGQFVYTHPAVDDPTSWIEFRMRIPNTAPAITGYDYGNYFGNRDANGHLSAVSSYFVAASLDGFTWDVVKTVNPAKDYYQNCCWAFSKGNSSQDIAAGSNNGASDLHPGNENGYCDPIPPAPAIRPNMLGNVQNVEISGGGKLTLEAGSAPITIKGLKVDALTGGTISGFEFAENGTVSVENVTSAVTELPLTVSGGTTFENVSGWSVTVNGVEKPAWSVKAKDGKLTLVRPGALLIVR